MCFGVVKAVWSSGIVCGLPVGFWLSVNILLRMGVLKKQDSAVVGVSCPPPFRPSFRSIECIRCSYTSGFRYLTHAVE